MMSLSLDEPRPIDSRGRASPPGEASSGELSGELLSYCPTEGRKLSLHEWLVTYPGDLSAHR